MATSRTPCHWSVISQSRCPLTSSTATSPALITSALAHIFAKDEVAVATASHVGMYDGDVKISEFDDGTCLLTSHRVFLVIGKPSTREEPTALEVHLKQIRGGTFDAYEGFGFLSHPKLIFTTLALEGSAGAGTTCKLSFRGGGFDSFRNAFRKCLERKLWALCSPPPRPVVPTLSSSTSNEPHEATAVTSLPPPELIGPTKRSDGLSFTDRAGIGGLQRAQHMDATSNEMKSTRALIDLDSALANTVTLTQEIKKLRSQIYGDGAETSNTSLTKDDINRLVSIEEALGLKSRKDSSSVVNRSDDGLALAQQFYAWITHPKNEASFFSRMFVPAKELYMLYLNKGVGTDAPATDPAVFRRALEQLEGMTTGRQGGNMCKLRCFSSGALVVELGSAQQRLISTLEGTLGARPRTIADMQSGSITWKRKGIDATRLGTLLHIDTCIALELLEDLELEEVLCRDEQFGEAFGVLCSFSWNWFLLR